MKMWRVIVVLVFIPKGILAQGVAGGVKSLQGVLDQLYTEMMPLCSELIGVGRLIAGFGALWYIGSRVWKHIASAEPIELYPLLRPFVLGFCIMIFPSVIALINGILHPTVSSTQAMVNSSTGAFDRYLQLKAAEDMNSTLGAFNPANWVREFLKDFLQVVFESASLCINTIRTFYLIVLAILGPFVFGLAVYDGFQHTLTVWLARYINVYLWLPVANIFGAIIAKIQVNMLMADTAAGGNFSMSDSGYLVFMVISIIGYFTVPSVANYIVNAGGGNTLLYKVSTLASSAAKSTVKAASTGAGMVADSFGNKASQMSGNMSDNALSQDYFKDKIGGK